MFDMAGPKLSSAMLLVRCELAFPGLKLPRTVDALQPSVQALVVNELDLPLLYLLKA